mgnify:CR=1 FL=1
MSKSNSSLFIQQGRRGPVSILLYVDDLVIAGADLEEIGHVKFQLATSFDRKDLGDLHYFLGIEVIRTPEGILISQRDYVLSMLFDGFGVPLMRSPGVKKALTSANEKLRRSTREKNPVSRFGFNDYMTYHYAFMMKVAVVREPESLAEAAKDLRWVEEMNEEMQALRENETCDLVPLSLHKKTIGQSEVYCRRVRQPLQSSTRSKGLHTRSTMKKPLPRWQR